jgi:carbamoyltransferase
MNILGLGDHVSYGQPRYVNLLRELIRYEDGTCKNAGNIFFNSALAELRQRLPRDFDRADLAASIQAHTEDMVPQYVQDWLKRCGKTNIAMVGGLFANVSVNRRVHEIPGVTGVFIHPGMSDEGMLVGQ